MVHRLLLALAAFVLAVPTSDAQVVIDSAVTRPANPTLSPNPRQGGLTPAQPAVDAEMVAAARRRWTLTDPSSVSNTPPQPHQIADGDVVEVEIGTPRTVSFWFASPERDQTTTVSVQDDDGVVAGQRIQDGAAAVVELDLFVSGGISAPGSEGTVTLTAVDNGCGSEETRVTFTTLAVNPPAAACDPTSKLDLTAFSPGGSFTLYPGDPRPFDFGPCTLVVFDPASGAVRSTLALAEVLAPYQDTDLRTEGLIPSGTFTAPRGAFALVRGTAAAGDPLADVLRSTDFVLGGVYDRDVTYVDTDDQNLFSSYAHSDPTAREMAFVAALSRWLGLSP